MSQSPEHPEIPEDPESPASPAEQVGATTDVSEESVRTGEERVDEVLAAIEQLEERPIEEHVGVFEHAHEELRRALDAHRDGPE